MSLIIYDPNIVPFDTSHFFAPIETDLIKDTIGRRNAIYESIKNTHRLMTSELKTSLYYFASGAGLDNAGRISNMFNIDLARQKLDADFWDEIIKKTDVMEFMTANHRSEWYNNIREFNKTDKDGNFILPEFTEETVRNTIGGLLDSRGSFFAEKVDGVFKSLSPQHLTNRPEGFKKRFILNNCISSYGSTNYDKMRVIDDLRYVVNKIAGRDSVELGFNSTRYMDYLLLNRGEWHVFDGGMIRMRGYMAGTIHCEIDPEMAWKLNAILATRYPNQIAPVDRKPPKKEKSFMKKSVNDLISNQVSKLLQSKGHYSKQYKSIHFNTANYDKVVVKQVYDILTMIGGTSKLNFSSFSTMYFDYDPSSVIEEIIYSGEVPNSKSYQFYPTPDVISQEVIKLANPDESDSILEPSAGNGDLISGLDDKFKQNLTLVELSKLRCEVLTSKGYENVINYDFVNFTKECLQDGTKYDIIIMNPPFSESRWEIHLDSALAICNKRVVCVLPSSAENYKVPNGWSMYCANKHQNEFAGTSINTMILVLEKI